MLLLTCNSSKDFAELNNRIRQGKQDTDWQYWSVKSVIKLWLFMIILMIPNGYDDEWLWLIRLISGILR